MSATYITFDADFFPWNKTWPPPHRLLRQQEGRMKEQGRMCKDSPFGANERNCIALGNQEFWAQGMPPTWSPE